MDLARFPRRKYLEAPTPLHALPHFSKALGGPNIYIKRDDLLPGTEGGNKTRKLEFVVGDAVEKGADTLITCGAIQSNHCRLTLSAAIKEGLSCRLILEERVKGSYKADANGNNSYIVLGRKILKLLILNDNSSISQDEDWFDAVFRWPKSAKNGIFDEFPQNLRFLKIDEYH